MSVEKFLKNNDFDFSIDKDGDYRISAEGNSLDKEVWISGHINYTGDIGIREIFSISASVDKEELQKISPVLLQDNRETRVIGNWALARNEENDRFVIMYIIKSPLNAEDNFILQSIAEASQASFVLEKVLMPED